jgi:hypothetical protein
MLSGCPIIEYRLDYIYKPTDYGKTSVYHVNTSKQYIAITRDPKSAVVYRDATAVCTHTFEHVCVCTLEYTHSNMCLDYKRVSPWILVRMLNLVLYTSTHARRCYLI